VFVCSQLQHTYRAVFLLLVTAASDLLVHNILLNCVLLSPIVCGSVRPKLPRQTPLGHNPLVFCRSWIGWGQDPASWVGRGQEYGLVSVFDKNTRRVLSYDVLRQQKKELWPRGCVRGVDFRLRRITSNASQTIIRSRLVQTATDAAVSARLDAFRRSSQLYFSHFATRTTCMQCTIRYDTIVCI